MKWREFVFGNGKTRIKRHLLFWTLGYLYFLSSFFFIQQGWGAQQGTGTLLIILLKSIPLLAGHIGITYTLLYATRRWVLETPKPLIFVALFVFSFGALTLYSYCCYRWVLLWVDQSAHLVSPYSSYPWWSAVTGGPLSALKFLLAAMAIQTGKRWYLKETENSRLRKEKKEAELQLLKAQVNPNFLFRSLEHIYKVSRSSPKEAAGELLRLSELLSYMLYETDQEAVELNKEIGMLKTYIELERSALGDRFDIAFTITGKTDDKWIAPLLLVPFLENSMLYCKDFHLIKPWVSIEINSSDNVFTMRLLNGKWEGQDAQLPNDIELERSKKRVGMLYPDRHELKIHSEPELMMTQLKIEALSSLNGEKLNWKPSYNN
jgi:hypothetical protein